MDPTVFIIILNWNSWRDTIECLESLYRMTYSPYVIVIVDNGSEDDSVKKINQYCNGEINVKTEFFEYNPDNKPINIIEYTRKEAEHATINLQPKQVILIKNEKNDGFAEGNNIGVRFSQNADYLLLLNSDTVVDPAFLERLIIASEKDDIGVVQPKILRRDNPRIIDSVGQEMYWDGNIQDIWFGKPDDKRFDTIHEIFGACATAALIKKKVLEKTGLFDPDFFLIFEDVDLSWRIRLAGYKTVLVPDAVVYHKRGVSGKLSRTSQFYVIRNRIYIAAKYFPLSYVLRFLPFYGYHFTRLLGLHYEVGESLSTFFKKLRACIKERSVIQKSPHYKKTVEQWIFTVDMVDWYKKKVKKLVRKGKGSQPDSQWAQN